ncbi:MAG: helicase HerA domain-containing protein [Promethearchaeota archaeon]
MVIKVGTVFNYLQLPDVSQFPFVISKRMDKTFIQKGLFVYTESNEGLLIGIIERIVLLNEYFTDALTIKAYNANNNPNILKGLFPSEDFEFAIALVKCLGIIKFKSKSKNEIEKILRMTYPASPGREVYILEEDLLNNFIGFDKENGLNLGKVKVTDTNANINMNRLLNKHFAILSISGGGKSYLTSILIEELLKRKENCGTPAVILFDVHGEYLYLKKIPEFKERVSIHDISYFQISVPKMPIYSFKKYQEDISNVQVRELIKFIKKLRKDDQKKGRYTIGDIIEQLENEIDGNKNTRQALIGWLSDLERLTLFGAQENPILDNIIAKKKITIFNLQNEISIRKKQIIVDYICNRLFNLRRLNKIPPFLLIIEEAHQFCLSEDTEILTKNGWKKHTEIKIGELAFSFNPQTKKLELNEIERIILKEHNGEMIKLFNNNSIDALVTKDHRVLCNYRTTGKDRKWCWSKDNFVFAKKLPNSIRIPLAAKMESITKCEIDDDLIRIIGWIITDGNIHNFEDKKYFSYEISQSEAKGEILTEMTEVITRRFPEVSVYKRKREDEIFKRSEENIFYFKKKASEEINSWLLNDAHRIPRIILENASQNQLKTLFDAMIQGDGNIQFSEKGYKYITFYVGQNEKLADDFQELCVRLGLSAIKSYVQQNNQIKVLISFKRKYAHVRKKITETYTGKVWDITIKNGAFIARRHGKVFFTGNCPEAAHSKAISKPIIEMIAREGRKFMSCLCLISQRPKRLSTTALSQCNSKMVLNIKNPYDLKHLMDSSEAITKEYANMISSLGVGEMLLMGTAVNYPVFIDIRERNYRSDIDEISLEQVCLNWENNQLK